MKIEGNREFSDLLSANEIPAGDPVYHADGSGPGIVAVSWHDDSKTVVYLENGLMTLELPSKKCWRRATAKVVVVS